MPPSPAPLPLIIDTDPGIDDTLALYLALNSPELDVRGISVSYGNTTVENAYRNAVEIVRHSGKRARLGVGARRPLTRALAVAAETHGESGLGYAVVPPAGVILDFVRPLDRLLAEQPEPVTLVTLGPLTSLALALKREPDLVRAKVARHVAMVGTIDARGNTTPLSEFNAWCDPEALAAVLAAGLPTELVGLDVTRQLVMSAEDVARLGATEAAKARWLHEALRFYVEFHRSYEGIDGCILNDVIPIAALVDPSVLRYEPMHIMVDLDDDERRGRTRVAADGVPVQVAVEVHVAPIRALLSKRVFRWAATSAPAKVA